LSAQILNNNTTELAKRAAILEAVTLASCDNDSTEQRLNIEKLISIVDDEVLDYVLNKYALPYRDFKEGRKVIDRGTLIDTNEFIRRVGIQRNFIYSIMYGFQPRKENS
jgi:hypothetical protein